LPIAPVAPATNTFIVVSSQPTVLHPASRDSRPARDTPSPYDCSGVATRAMRQPLVAALGGTS
jgi:hypothetical protein